jgi:hypothetical protein
MRLFPLDHGDLIRPPFRIQRGRGRGQCTNATSEYLIVYGPKHLDERSIFDTSPYVLPPGKTTRIGGTARGSSCHPTEFSGDGEDSDTVPWSSREVLEFPALPG